MFPLFTDLVATMTITTERFQPEYLEPWTDDGPTAFDSSKNYSGEDFTEFYVAPVGTSRDADLLTQSHYDVISKSILEASTHDETDCHSFGHWACGWDELLLIHRDDTPALERAEQWACALENHPVANEDHYSELEFTTASDNWYAMSLRERIEACARYDVSVFSARRDCLPESRTGELMGYVAGTHY